LTAVERDRDRHDWKSFERGLELVRRRHARSARPERDTGRGAAVRFTSISGAGDGCCSNSLDNDHVRRRLPDAT
jgi:hypothetical protein